MKNFETFKKDFKQDLLIQVVIGMRHGKMSEGASKTMVRKLIEVLSEEDAGSVFQKINKLGEIHPEILDILIKRGYEFDTREREERVEEIYVYLTGNIRTKQLELYPKGGEN